MTRKRWQYTCPVCGPVEATQAKGAIPCPSKSLTGTCGKLALRDWSAGGTPLQSTTHPSKTRTAPH